MLKHPTICMAFSSLTGDLLFDILWEAVSRLERQGICVLTLTCDGASSNHRLWRLHTQNGSLTHKVMNIYAPDGARPLYFISNPPHLIKTIRNCWWNSRRELQVRKILIAIVCHTHSTIIVVQWKPHFMEVSGDSLQQRH